MKKEELESWKRTYSSVRNIEFEIDFQIRENNENIDEHQLSFTQTLANLCFSKDSPDDFIQQHGLLYRWVWRYEQLFMLDEPCAVARHMESVVSVMGQERNSVLPKGWKWMLQLLKENKWWDWVYVKQSTLPNANLGLFCARHFTKGNILGYYVGHTIYVAEEEGGAPPSEEELDAAETEDSPYAISVRDKDGLCRVIDPDPVEPIDDDEETEQGAAAAGEQRPPTPLYMGMHYMNNACVIYREDTTRYEQVKADPNCQVLSDGSVQCTKKLYKNDELFLPYRRKETTKTKAKKKRVEDDERKPRASSRLKVKK